MKLKYLFIAAMFLTLPLLAGCNKNVEIYDDSVNNSANSAEQTEEFGQDEAAEKSNAEEQGNAASAENTNSESEVTIMYVTINSNKLEVELAQNSSVSALVDILKQTDITYTADDYGNFEKVGNIGYTLPRNDEEITTQAGDVILYQGNCICLYYGENTWSFTRIGKINGYSEDQLKELLAAGEGKTEVTISLN